MSTLLAASTNEPTTAVPTPVAVAAAAAAYAWS